VLHAGGVQVKGNQVKDLNDPVTVSRERLPQPLHLCEKEAGTL